MNPFRLFASRWPKWYVNLLGNLDTDWIIGTEALHSLEKMILAREKGEEWEGDKGMVGSYFTHTSVAPQRLLY